MTAISAMKWTSDCKAPQRAVYETTTLAPAAATRGRSVGAEPVRRGGEAVSHYPLPTCETPLGRRPIAPGARRLVRHRRGDRRAAGARRLSHRRPGRAPTRGHGAGRRAAARRRRRRGHHPLGRRRHRRPRRRGQGGVGRGRRLDVDCVVLASGVLGEQSHLEDDPAAAAELAVANYAGPVSTLLHVARRLEEQGHGTIVVLSSVAGERVRRSNFVYGSSKAGLDALRPGARATRWSPPASGSSSCGPASSARR